MCEGSGEPAPLSAGAAADPGALETARPALLQLARALRSRAEVAPRGAALAYILLTDPYGALYRPAYRDELYEIAREALFALRPDRGAPRTQTQGRRVGGLLASVAAQIRRWQPPALPQVWRAASADVTAMPHVHAPPHRARSFNDAAHKVGDWAPQTRPDREERSAEVRRRFEALADPDRDVIAHAGRAVLALGALGVVYGDIGTSPLYTGQVLFTSYRATAHLTAANVFGVVSLIFWALTIVVSIKYAGFIMRAHNRGDGGIMGLTALLQRRPARKRSRACRARHLRRRPVPRRRDDHAGDLGPRAPSRA